MLMVVLVEADPEAVVLLAVVLVEGGGGGGRCGGGGGGGGGSRSALPSDAEAHANAARPSGKAHRGKASCAMRGSA